MNDKVFNEESFHVKFVDFYSLAIICVMIWGVKYILFNSHAVCEQLHWCNQLNYLLLLHYLSV